ncbi:MAG: DNA alkylation repair protein [Ignavibacteriaceae bacterium]
MDLREFRRRIKEESNKQQAKSLQWFFKTGAGEYGEGDVFAGIKMPVQRKIAKKFKNLNYDDIRALVASKIHEERMIGLLILQCKYEKGDEKEKEKVFKFYIRNRKGINNWDLVDISAPKIVGEYLLNRDKKLLYEFAHSKNLWERRIAILSTFTFIRAGKFETTFKISDVLLDDNHDLIHKAVGWMLREIGKKDLDAEEKFLKLRSKKMHRTMLRYAIEKFPEVKRKKYLLSKI